MAKKLFMQIRQNWILSLRNSLVWVVLVSMAVIILVVKFAVPDNRGAEEGLYYLDETEGKLIQAALIAGGLEDSSFAKDYGSLEKMVLGNRTVTGVVIRGTLQNPETIVLRQNGMNSEQLKLVQTSLSKMLGTLNGDWDGALDVESLRPWTEPIPRNLTLVPVLLVFEVLILGFLLIAVFLFQEKADKVLRAYRISPGGTHLYIAAKILAFLALGLVYAFGIVIFTYGFDFRILDFFLLTVLGFTLYTLIGLIVALFFEDISGWFTVGIVLLVINMAPGISHQLPSFAPAFMKFIPSYHILFGYDDILFSNGKSLAPTYGLLTALCVAAYLACTALVRRKLMKEVR